MSKIVQFRKKNQVRDEDAHQALKNLMDIDPEAIYDTHLTNQGVVYRLRLELKGSRREEYSQKNQEKWNLLQKYGKAETAVSRTILAPGDMTLHALHYAIQRLFGWQNGHLHRFYLPQEEFESLTAGRLDTFSQLCGSLFRFPEELSAEDFRDDDYEEGENFKTWLRSKYRRPYLNLSPHDTFVVNASLAGLFGEEHPEIKEDELLKTLDHTLFPEAPWNTLMESLQLKDLFLKMPDHETRPETREWVADTVASTEDLCAFMAAAFDEPRSDQEIIRRLDLLMARVQMLPYFDTLCYNYDSGDDWNVRIILEEVYYPDFEFLDEESDSDDFYEEDDFEDDFDEEEYIRKMLEGMPEEEDYQYLDANRKAADEELVPLLRRVDDEGKPVCILSDGLNVLDDCGGVDGYIHMLSVLNGKDREQASEMRAWSRMMGWTGRKIKVENML